MNHHSKAITGILLAQTLLFGIPALADTTVTVDTVDTTSSQWVECLNILRLDKDIAERGTYKVRMVQCVNEKIRAAEVGDLDREYRLNLRAQKIRRAFESGRLNAARSVSQPANAVEDRRVVPTTQFRRYTTNTTSRDSSNENVSHARPSRRSIKARAVQLTRSSKQRASDEYQQRWLEAVQACEGIDNNFHRSNCIRRQLRQTFR